jgi:hypothetical protein
VADDAGAGPELAEAGLRLAALVALAGLVAGLAFAGRPGAALVVGALLAPVPLLLVRLAYWPLPAAAPVLGVAGIAPLYPALAALAGTPARRFALAVVGWAWLAVAEAALGASLLFETLEPAPAGWTSSPAGASELLAGLIAPAALIAAAVWGAAAVVLGYLLRGRLPALELLGVLVWAAGLVGAHRLLAGGHGAPSAAPLALGAVCVALAALWVRHGGRALHPGRASGGLA